MLDIKLLRQDPQAVAVALLRRGYQLDVTYFTRLEEQRRAIQAEADQLAQQRNQAAKDIGQAKARGEDVGDISAQVQALSAAAKQQAKALKAVNDKIMQWLVAIPNLLADDVPEGQSEHDNVEISRVGEPTTLPFAKDHVALTAQSGQMDFDAGAVLSGSRFVVLRGALAQLHRALGQWMLNHHISAGYIEHNLPVLVKQEALQGAGQLPKFADDLYLLDEHGMGLLPTAEVGLASLCRDRVFCQDQLPLRWVAHTACFRQEAGSYGKDTRGMIRMHQFEKVELFQVVAPDQAEAALQSMCQQAASVLDALGLPYRIVQLCAGDIGFSAEKTYDLEVWLPSQQAYREIASISTTGSFQARRLKARYRQDDGAMAPVHLLNGSGVAIGRALVAVLENYQQQDGRILIPEVLRPFLMGMTHWPA